MINGHGQSDGEIVPEKSPNNLQGMEGRSPVKGNVQEHSSHRTQSRTEEMQPMLERIRKAVTPIRYYLRQEPSAGKPHARIREGGSLQRLSLPRQHGIQ